MGYVPFVLVNRSGRSCLIVLTKLFILETKISIPRKKRNAKEATLHVIHPTNMEQESK